MFKKLHKLEVNPELAKRIQTFISSELFTVHSSIAKSEYWKGQSEKFETNITDGAINIAGDIGYDVPNKSSFLKRNTQKVVRAITQPSKIVGRIKAKVDFIFKVPKFMSYEKAFDAVMRHDEVSDPDLSRFRIEHRKLAKHNNVIKNAELLKQHYEGWSSYKAEPNIILHYYYQNILHGFIKDDEVTTVLEIGAGTGNFPAIIYHDWAAPKRMILVDLPETLAIAISFLSNSFPNATMLLPDEAKASGLEGNFDFAFLTVDQLDLIQDNSIDLAINCHSFMEMTHEQIDVYFELIQHACRESGFFFTANRVEKIPCGADAFTVEQPEPPNRFAEYPWDAKNEVLVYEVSRLSRLVQLDNLSIRLERIHK